MTILLSCLNTIYYTYFLNLARRRAPTELLFNVGKGPTAPASPGAYQRLSGPTQDLLNQNTHFHKTQKCFISTLQFEKPGSGRVVCKHALLWSPWAGHKTPWPTYPFRSNFFKPVIESGARRKNQRNKSMIQKHPPINKIIC